MYHFCTLFDSNYLLRGLTLYRSIKSKKINFKFYVLCLDEVTYKTLSSINLENIVLINQKELEGWDPELTVVKQNRRKVEYYFTLSPILPLYILKEFNNIDVVTYLDADIFFYSNPDVLYKEMGDKSILIVEHDYSENIAKRFEGHGKYNVEYLSFKNDKQGLRCLERWGEQCKAWCFDKTEDGLYADQAYLNEWPKLYESLVISNNKGVGLAPWNCNKYGLKNINSEIFVDEEELVFYHFHGVRILSKCFISQNLRAYKAKLKSEIKSALYRKYIDEIRQTHLFLVSSGVNDISFKDKVIGKRIKSQNNRTLIDKFFNFINSIYYVC